MLTQDDIQRERYESRMKGLMDYRSELKAERQDGIWVGQIQMLQKLLREVQTPADDLNALPDDSLKLLHSHLLESARRAGLPV